MKKTINVFGAMRNIAIIALVAVIGFSFAACDTGGGGNSSSGGSNSGGNSSKKIFTSVSNLFDIFKLEITCKGGNPATGDSYVLSVYDTQGSSKGTSTGKITVSSGTYTLSNGGTVTVSGSDMTAISGTINKDGGGTITAPASLAPLKEGGDGSLNGTWKRGSTETVTFNGSSFTYKGTDITAPGTAAYNDSVLFTYGVYRGDAWVVAGKYTLKSSPTAINFTESGGYTEFNGDWVKQ